ncbi:MAG TPA: FAD-dependent oxidoreductase, partial [Tianweitania sediminis]|nr:FAD-dependent oxidoreductase [Tianweitania sediminis]
MTDEEKMSVCDLIIVGGGLAGLVAGVRAAEMGLRPVILEKGSGGDYPCNSRQSGGILHIGFHDPFRDADELTQIIMRLTDGEAQPELAAALAGNTSRLISWLQEKGTRFMRFNQLEGYKWCMAPPRALRAGIDWKGRGPDLVLRKLVAEFERLDGQFIQSARAKRLILRKGTCIGVEGEHEGRPAVWHGRAVLIADGG